MAGTLTETVTAYFDVSGSDTVFILDDPAKGLLDGATYTLAGDVATDISSLVRQVRIRRGRERVLDEITVGVASVEANNFDRTLDPEYAAGVYFGNIIPGKRISFATNGISIFDGQVDDWKFDWRLGGGSTASFEVADALAHLGASQFDDWTPTDGQTCGLLIEEALDRPEVAFPASRNIGAGVTVTGNGASVASVSFGTNVLNYLQLVAKCDLGQFFAAKDGTLTFYGRERAITTVGAPSFTDDGTGIPFSDIRLSYGTELLYNRVSIEGGGFTRQTVTDQTSIDAFGGIARSLYIFGMPFDSEPDVLGLAEYLLSLYGQPVTRIQSVTVMLHGLEAADQATVLNLDIGSVVSVTFTPEGVGDPITKSCVVEGVEHQIAPMFHAVRLSLSNLAEGFTGSFILDDATQGVLDSTEFRLTF